MNIKKYNSHKTNNGELVLTYNKTDEYYESETPECTSGWGYGSEEHNAWIVCLTIKKIIGIYDEGDKIFWLNTWDADDTIGRTQKASMFDRIYEPTRK